MTDKVARIFLTISVTAFIGPNGLYIYTLFTDPGANLEAINNPIALAFMVEAIMLLCLFLYYVYCKTKSMKQVFLYLILSFIGSLAFSFPLFIYLDFKKNSRDERRC